MQIQAQLTHERRKLGELIADIQIAMLTFVDSQGDLVSQPMVPLMFDSDGLFWFFTDCHTEKKAHLAALNLPLSDTSKSVYVSICGHGELICDPERQQALWSPTMKPWFTDGPTAANLCLLKLTPQLAEYWDALHSPVIRLFAMVASMATATPIGLGEHARLTRL